MKIENDERSTKKDAIKKNKSKTVKLAKGAEVVIDPDVGDNYNGQKIGEAVGKTAVFAFGRMNPPTSGHEVLVNKVVQTARGKGTPFVFLTHSQDMKKNPLSSKDKISFARSAFGRSLIQPAPGKTLIEVMKHLEKSYKEVIMVAGSDRVDEFKRLLNKYNGKDFNFDSIKVVSAGERDPDAEGASGMSASKMRQAAIDNKFSEFKKGLPSNFRRGNKMFKAVRKGLGIREDINEEFEDFLAEVLTVAGRRKKAIAARRNRLKLRRARARLKFRFADQNRLKKRARRAAIRAVRKRVAGSRATKYAKLSMGQKAGIDRLVAKRKKIIGKIATRLTPKQRKAEAERLKSARKKASTNESIDEPAVDNMSQVEADNIINQATPQDQDIKKRKGTQPARYHKGLSKSTKARRDAHFKKHGKKADNDPSAYKPAPGDARAKTKPSKYTKMYHDMYGESLDERMFGKTGPFGGKSQGSVLMPSLDRAIDQVVNRKEYKDAVRAYLNFRRKNKSDRSVQGKSRENIAFDFFRNYGVQSPKQMIKYIDGLVKKGKLPKQLAISEETSYEMYRDMFGQEEMELSEFFTIMDRMEEELSTGSKARQEREKKQLAIKHEREKARAAVRAIRREDIDNEFEMSLKSEGALADKSKKSGISVGTLRKVYNRGVAAWKTGHRPGTTPQQWGYARVNAFIAKKKKGTLNHDKDLA